MVPNKPTIGAIFFPLTKHKPAAISGININIIANNIVLFFNKSSRQIFFWSNNRYFLGIIFYKLTTLIEKMIEKKIQEL